MSVRDLIGQGDILLAPGIYDALSGLIATQMGAKAVYLSGASLAYTRFGRSDIGLVSVSEVHDTLAAMTDRIETPVIVDADNGFGNALNVQINSLRSKLNISETPHTLFSDTFKSTPNLMFEYFLYFLPCDS